MHGARGSGPRASQSRGPSTPASATLDFAQVRSAATETCVDAGTRLYAAGEAVDRVVVLGSGEVELLAHSSAGRRVMAIVREGGVIGDIPLFLGMPMPFDAVVSRRARVCQLQRDAFTALLRSSPSVSLQWMRSIALRLDEDRRRLLAIMTTDLTAQVAFLLVRQAERGVDGDAVVHLSHEVLAQLVGARRQSVSRVVAALQARGLVSSAYRRIIVHDVEGLEEVAGPSLPARPVVRSSQG